ncbi:MAG: NUDIX domain-containing protein, partial [Bacillota bacterium]
MEYFDVYDKYGNKTGKTIERGTPLKTHEYIKIIHVWIEHSNGEYLIQKRAKKDDAIPHQWAITTGAVTQGETAQEAALRELHEELGLTFKERDLTVLDTFTSRRLKFHTITTVFHIQKDIDLNTITIDPKEVLAVRYESLDN